MRYDGLSGDGLTDSRHDKGTGSRPGGQYTQPRLAAWLGQQWIADGPPVCLVEGFSGLGKSHLARQVRDGYPHLTTYVEIADAHTSFGDFLLKTQGTLKSQADISIPLGADTSIAIEQALRDNLLVVVDDFQNCLAPGTHGLTEQFATFFRQVRSRRAGRLLLLTSQSVDEDQCQDLGIVQHTLVPLSPEDGGALLQRLLAARDRQDEVPTNRVAELAQWLGSNPRAMQALVAALRFTRLAELVGIEPDGANIGYRQVDELLVANLEKKFVRRSMNRLAPAELQLLERLSVHRKSFRQEAITLAHNGIDSDVRRAIQELVNLFFLEHHRGQYTLNPTARELALRSVLRNHQATRTAHRHAADFYFRHFKAKQTKPIALADKFMEARHHLHLSGRSADLRELAQTFALYLQRSAMSQSVADDPEELDEQILLLDAALEQGSPSSLLNLRLARMLLQRGRDGDPGRALMQTTVATTIPPVSEEAWRLHLVLVHQTEGLDAVASVFERARATLPAASLWPISAVYIRLLLHGQRHDKALKLVLNTIAAKPDSGGDRQAAYICAIKLLDQAGDDHRVGEVIAAALAESDSSASPDYALYHACINFYMSRHNYPAAVALLDEGLQRVAPTSNLVALYLLGIKLHMSQDNYPAAVALLDEGLQRVAPTNNLVELYFDGIKLHMSQDNYPPAVALLDDGLRVARGTHLVPLWRIGIKLHMEREDREAAISLVTSGVSKISPKQAGAFGVYQLGIALYAQLGDVPAALALLDEGLRKLPPRAMTASLVSVGVRMHLGYGDLNAALRLGFSCLAIRQNTLVVESMLLAVYRFAQRPDTAVQALQWWDKIDKVADADGTVLSQVLRLLEARAWTEAAEVAACYRQEKAARASIVRYEALAFLAAGDPVAAHRAATAADMTSSSMGIPAARHWAQSWLMALMHAVRGDDAEAWQVIAEHWDVEPGADAVTTCIDLWLQESVEFEPVLSTFFPLLPKEITGMTDDLIHPSVFKPEILPAAAHDTRPGPAVVALATEWSSTHGGLSTLNRQLCCALAAQGAQVVCMVLSATDAELRDAEAMGVTLRVAVGPPGGSDHAALSSHKQIPVRFKPDYIIGHSRVTGPAAYQLAEHFPEAKRLHLIHMAPDEIEWHKPDRTDDAGERSDKRHQIEIDLACTAHRTVAIGPRLYKRYGRDLSRFDTARVVCLVPGFDTANDRPRTPPPGEPWKILVTGRAEDTEIKGLDIAAKAVGLAARNRAVTAPRVELLVRGAPQGKAEELRREVLTWAGLPGLDVVVRPYSADRESMVGDLETSTLVLMPSRKEGFGLVGLEAITAGVPVLVSASSGLGDYLRSVLDPQDADRVVVPMSGDLDVDADRWSLAISTVLFDPEAAFRRAATLRKALATRNNWAHAVTELLALL
jgi:glycosyltransferase involved in cell wall biosynthesis/tetratricopeptide (TPR) repeat protein